MSVEVRPSNDRNFTAIPFLSAAMQRRATAMLPLVPTGITEAARKLGLVRQEKVIPLDNLYEGEGNWLPLAKVNAGRFDVEIGYIRVKSDQGNRDLIGITFSLPDVPNESMSIQYGMVYAPGRLEASPSLSADDHEELELAITTEKNAISYLMNTPIIGESFPFPHIVSDISHNQYIAGIPRFTLSKALTVLGGESEELPVLGKDRKELSLEERQIISLLLLKKAFDVLAYMNQKGKVHGDARGSNFHVTENFGVTAIDLTKVTDVSNVEQGYDITSMQDTVLSDTFNLYNAMRGAGITRDSTPQDIVNRLHELCLEYGYDLTDQKVLTELTYKFRRAMVKDALEPLLRYNGKSITNEDVELAIQAIDTVIEQAPTILLY